MTEYVVCRARICKRQHGVRDLKMSQEYRNSSSCYEYFCQRVAGLAPHFVGNLAPLKHAPPNPSRTCCRAATRALVAGPCPLPADTLRARARCSSCSSSCHRMKTTTRRWRSCCGTSGRMLRRPLPALPIPPMPAAPHLCSRRPRPPPLRPLLRRPLLPVCWRETSSSALCSYAPCRHRLPSQLMRDGR